MYNFYRLIYIIIMEVELPCAGMVSALAMLILEEELYSG